MPHRREELHLCDYDSTVSVNFYLLEFAVLWRICALSWCIGGSEREDERRGSFDNEPFGDFSEVRYHVTDVTMGDVIFFVEDFAELTHATGGR